MYSVIKRYGHEVGLSCCFRQWRAESHCSKLHGYSLAITLEFGADRLDAHGWVIDFGDLKPVRSWLQSTFDHKLLVAQDDPQLRQITDLHNEVANVIICNAVGCEAFARMIGVYVKDWLKSQDKYKDRVRIYHVTVSEHSANSASYEVEYD